MLSSEKRGIKSSERAKAGTNLKVSTLGITDKPDFANIGRQPASTKNNVKKQLDGQGQISTGISKKTITDSLARSTVP